MISTWFHEALQKAIQRGGLLKPMRVHRNGKPVYRYISPAHLAEIRASIQ